MRQLDRPGKLFRQPRAKQESAARVKRLCNMQAPRLIAALCPAKIPVPFALTDQKHWRRTKISMPLTFVVWPREYLSKEFAGTGVFGRRGFVMRSFLRPLTFGPRKLS